MLERRSTVASAMRSLTRTGAASCSNRIPRVSKTAIVAHRFCEISRRIFPFIERVFADSGYAGEKVARARGQAVLRSSRHRRPGQLPVRRGPRRLKTQKDQTKGKRTMSLEDIDECLRWMKEGRAVRIRWQSGCTLWTRFDNQTGRPVADAENVFLGDGSFPLRRHGTDIVQDQSPISVVLENLLAPKT